MKKIKGLEDYLKSLSSDKFGSNVYDIVKKNNKEMSVDNVKDILTDILKENNCTKDSETIELIAQVIVNEKLLDKAILNLKKSHGGDKKVLADGKRLKKIVALYKSIINNYENL